MDNPATVKKLASQLGIPYTASLQATFSKIAKSKASKTVSNVVDLILQDAATEQTKTVKHKIQVPPRPPSAAESRKQVEQEMLALAFTEGVLKVVGAYAGKLEKSVRAKENERLKAAVPAFCGPAKLELARNTLMRIEDARRMLGGTVSQFLEKTDPICAHINPNSSPSVTTDPNVVENLIQSLKEPVCEREKYRRQKLQQASTGDRKGDKYEVALMSRIDFRAEKLLLGNVSLDGFMLSSMKRFSAESLQDKLFAVETALQAPLASVREREMTIQTMLAELPILTKKMESMTAKRAVAQRTVNDLKAKVVKERGKITKLNKISFQMRLDTAIKDISKQVEQEYYASALTKLQAEVADLKSKLPATTIDTETGFEIPFCPFSDSALEAEARSMVLDAHTEYLVINESVEETTTMLAEIVRFRKEDLTHALEAFSDSCDAHVDACRQLMVDTANVDWSHVGEMMRSLFPPSQEKIDKLRKTLASLNPLILSPPAIEDPTIEELRVSTMDTIALCRERNLAGRRMVDEIDRTLARMTFMSREIELSSRNPLGSPSSSSSSEEPKNLIDEFNETPVTADFIQNQVAGRLNFYASSPMVPETSRSFYLTGPPNRGA